MDIELVVFTFKVKNMFSVKDCAARVSVRMSIINSRVVAVMPALLARPLATSVHVSASAL